MTAPTLQELIETVEADPALETPEARADAILARINGRSEEYLAAALYRLLELRRMRNVSRQTGRPGEGDSGRVRNGLAPEQGLEIRTPRRSTRAGEAHNIGKVDRVRLGLEDVQEGTCEGRTPWDCGNPDCPDHGPAIEAKRADDGTKEARKAPGGTGSGPKVDGRSKKVPRVPCRTCGRKLTSGDQRRPMNPAGRRCVFCDDPAATIRHSGKGAGAQRIARRLQDAGLTAGEVKTWAYQRGLIETPKRQGTVRGEWIDGILTERKSGDG